MGAVRHLRGAEPISPDGVDADLWRWTRVALAADALTSTLHAGERNGSSEHSTILATATSRVASAAALSVSMGLVT